MSEKVFYLAYRDTRPVIQPTLYDPKDADGVRSIHDLTGAASATMHVYLPGGSVFSRAMTIDADPTTGQVSYTWLEADWDELEVGHHRMVYEVLGPGTARLTFPNDGDHHTLRISDDIGQAT